MTIERQPKKIRIRSLERALEIEGALGKPVRTIRHGKGDLEIICGTESRDSVEEGYIASPGEFILKNDPSGILLDILNKQ